MTLVLSRLALAERDEISGFVAERSPLGAKHVEARFSKVARMSEAICGMSGPGFRCAHPGYAGLSQGSRAA